MHPDEATHKLTSFIQTAANSIGNGFRQRITKIAHVTGAPLLLIASIPKRALGMPVLTPFDPTNATMVAQDVWSINHRFLLGAWRDQATWIRNTHDLDVCLARLSAVLAAHGPIWNSWTSGAVGALSLLPTAGALIGAPARELWIVYQLMPLAGLLSMLLSLGGNIVPNQTGEYTLQGKKFNYGGFIRTARQEEEDYLVSNDHVEEFDGTEPQRFARTVLDRANDVRGSRKILSLSVGIALQLFFVGTVIGACCLLQAGTVVVWCCQVWGWMLAWYSAVASSSVFDNVASVPFTSQWTIRASKAPEVTISQDSPVVTNRCPVLPGRRTSGNESAESSVDCGAFTSTESPSSISTHDGIFTINNVKPNFRAEPMKIHQSPPSIDAELQPLAKNNTDVSIVSNLQTGFNCTGAVAVHSDQPHSRSIVPFYVVISLEGVSTTRAILRVIFKAASVGAFAIGTAMFASTTLTTIKVGTIVICMVLGAGVFGRVVSMWMASEMMTDNPMLHKTVHSNKEAAEYLNEVLSLPGITFEVMGHVIVNGRCIHRYNRYFNWPLIFGIAAPPFDITKLAVSPPRVTTKEL